jgi:hypothetical protein
MMKSIALFWLVAVLPCTASSQIVPIGDQFQVNTYTTGNQVDPAIAIAENGRLVVVWTSIDQDGEAGGIFGQQFESGGSRLGEEFQVNTHSDDGQTDPAVVMTSADGAFVSVWTSDVYDEEFEFDWGDEIRARRYLSGGMPVGTDFVVEGAAGPYTSNFLPDIGADTEGNFVVVWNYTDIWSGAIPGRRFDSGGLSLGPTFWIDDGVLGNSWHPSTAMDDDGNFVAVWNQGLPGLVSDVSVRLYEANGDPFGDRIEVAPYETHPDLPDIAQAPNGDFVVAWQAGASLSTDTDGTSIQVKQYRPDGVSVGGYAQVNTYIVGNQGLPAVAVDPGGNFVVVWHSSDSDGSGFGIRGRWYLSDGTPISDEFQVNTYTSGNQLSPDVAIHLDGTFVVVWQSDGSPGDDSSGYSVQGRRFTSLTVNELESWWRADGDPSDSRGANHGSM